MKLLIVSHTPHYQSGLQVVGWGPTVRELDYLATLFDEIVHIAPLHEEEAPASALPYQSTRIRHAPVRAGEGLKAGALAAPSYVATILKELSSADAWHVRCPAGISLIASVMMAAIPGVRRRWIKYAGNWQPSSAESWSYSFQRYWLQTGWHRARVTVNGDWKNQPPFIHSFTNPSLTDNELIEGQNAAPEKALTGAVRLLFVGRLEEAKGASRAIEIARKLSSRGASVLLDMVGDGPERATFEEQAAMGGIRNQVRFHGWLPRADLAPLYRAAHFVLLPTASSEGWPKVLSEGMAYGCVPLAGNVSCISAFLTDFKTGVALDPLDVDAFVRTILHYAGTPATWKHESQNAVSSAYRFGYTYYIEAVRRLLDLPISTHKRIATAPSRVSALQE